MIIFWLDSSCCDEFGKNRKLDFEKNTNNGKTNYNQNLKIIYMRHEDNDNDSNVKNDKNDYSWNIESCSKRFVWNIEWLFIFQDFFVVLRCNFILFLVVYLLIFSLIIDVWQMLGWCFLFLSFVDNLCYLYCWTIMQGVVVCVTKETILLMVCYCTTGAAKCSIEMWTGNKLCDINEKNWQVLPAYKKH